MTDSRLLIQTYLDEAVEMGEIQAVNTHIVAHAVDGGYLQCGDPVGVYR